MNNDTTNDTTNDKNQIVINGNNLELLKQYPDNYFDAVVTDPPYGLGKEPDATQMLQAWITDGYMEVTGAGFMGKEWDAFVPQPIFWKEVFRVLKHGGHVLSFFGTRTYDWGVMAMRLAGFEVRDCIQWVYGSGFPKSHNISKAIDKFQGTYVEGEESVNSRSGVEGDKNGYDHSKRITLPNPQSEDAKQWEGFGSALKPAVEPIVLARKPLEKGLSIAENVLKWGTGAINIDGCRIGYSENNKPIPQLAQGKTKVNSNKTMYDGQSFNKSKTEATIGGSLDGRFPANIILSHHPDCECKGLKKIKTNNKNIEQKGTGGIWQKSSGLPCGNQYGDENGEETIEVWKCHEDCPIKIMDEQSGLVGGDKRTSKSTYDKGIWGNAKPIVSTALYNDTGGSSRFFYIAKASKSERNRGLNGFDTKQTKGGGVTYNEEAGAKYGSIKAEGKNFHPTVKPVKLMQYLVRLITPPNGIVLDPFCGSGTTGIACKLENFNFVGMELDAEYSKIAEARIANYTEEPEPELEFIEEEQDNIQLALF